MTKKIDRPYKFRQHWESKKQRCLELLRGMSDLELAYLAGFIDGEGTISFRKMQKGYYRPILEIVNTDPFIVKYLQRYFWQKVSQCKNSRQVPYLRVNLTGFGIAPFLEALFPYLIAKKLQAKLVLKYIEFRYWQEWRTSPSPEMVEIYQDVKILNSHGQDSLVAKEKVREKYESF
jgi:hypothetical protein